MSRLLERWDIQPRPFWALLRALLLMDLRSVHYGNSTGAKPNEPLPPLFYVVGMFLFTSGVSSAFLFARVDAWFFTLANLAGACLLVTSALVVEFHEAAFDPADVAVIGHRPLHPRTYAAARLANALCYVTLMGLSVTIFPAIVGAAQVDVGPWFLPAYLLASGVTIVATAGAVLLAYLSLGSEKLETAKRVLAWAHVALMVFVFYGAQLALRKGSGALELFAAQPPEWVRALPLAWFSTWVEEVSRGPRPGHLTGAAIGVGVAGGLALLAGWRLSRAYASAASRPTAWGRVTYAAPAPGTLRGGVTRWLCRSRVEAVGFWLTRALLKRDGELSARSWPTLGTPVALMVVAAFLPAGDAATNLTIAILPFLAAAVPLVVQNLAFSREAEASWLLAAAPLADRAQLLAGVRKATLASLFYPVLLVWWVVLAGSGHPPLTALIQVGLAALVIEGAARVSFVRVLRGLPFTQTITRGATLGPVLIESALTFVLAGGVNVAWVAVARTGSGPARLGFLIGVAVAVVALDRWATRRLRGRA